VETLIVLAITGIVAAVAISLVVGRTENTSFSIGINNLQQEMQQLISESADDYYPAQGTFNCVGGTTSTTQPTISSSPANPAGENSGCIYLGKIVQFSPPTNTSQYVTYTVVGNEYDDSEVSQTVSNTDPVALMASGVDTSDSKAIDDHLTTYSITATTAANPMGPSLSIGAFGFLAGDASGNIASYNGSDQLNSGSQEQSLYYVAGSSLSEDTATLISNNTGTSGDITTANLQAAGSVTVCLTDGTKSAAITIDGSTGLTVSQKLYGGSTTCA
jgi:hypothetical protein